MVLISLQYGKLHYEGEKVKAETPETIILRWTRPGGSEMAGIRIGFEWQMGSVDGIRYGSINAERSQGRLEGFFCLFQRTGSSFTGLG